MNKPWSSSSSLPPPHKYFDQNDFKLLLDRVITLEESVQQLVSWAKCNLGFDGGYGAGAQVTTLSLPSPQPRYRQSKRNRGRSQVEQQVAKKSTGGITKKVETDFPVNVQVPAATHLYPGDEEEHDKDQDGDDSCGGSDRDKLHQVDQEIAAVKLEPLDFEDGFEQDGMLEENPEIDPLSESEAERRNNDSNFAVNYDNSEDSEDKDYKPNVLDEYTESENESRKKIKPMSNFVKGKIISETVTESLPNPYIRIGPKLTSTELIKFNIKLPENKKKRIRNRPKRIPKPRKERKPFKCEHAPCQYITNFKRKYVEHVRKHTGERPHVCTVCGKGFRGSWAVVSHMRSHANQKESFACETCQEQFYRKESLQKHINENHKDKRRQCDICQGIYTNKHTLAIHKRLQHNSQHDYICQICGYRFPYSARLKHHVKLHSNPNYKPRGPIVREAAAIKPPSEKLDLEKVYTTPPLHICSEEGCGKKYITNELLQVHVRRYHMTKEQLKVTCSICYKVLTDLAALKSHMRIVHKEERRNICSICGQGFKTGSHLRRHERGHSKPDWKPRANCKPKKFPGAQKAEMDMQDPNCE